METQLESLKTLREGIASLAPGDQGFAASLIVQYDAKGALTEKQWYWIERLAADVGAGDVPDFTQQPRRSSMWASSGASSPSLRRRRST